MANMQRRTRLIWLMAAILGAALADSPRAAAQSAPAPRRRTSVTRRPPRALDSYVGYIDNAVPADLIRLRYDASYDNVQPTRGEFFWATPQSLGGRGVPSPITETRVDSQQFSAHLEKSFGARFSGFVEAPIRLVNPEINDNAAGLGDMNLGFKWAILATPDAIATFQFRTYVPTGEAERGLGAGHVSLEPSLLAMMKLGSRVVFEAEIRDWVPVGGFDGFAGNTLRYGLGIGYQAIRSPELRVTPVAEFVGWTLLDGKSVIADPSRVESAVGDTIVNLKVGARFAVGRQGDFYAGYGRALTGDTWYRETLRLEYRRAF